MAMTPVLVRGAALDGFGIVDPSDASNASVDDGSDQKIKLQRLCEQKINKAKEADPFSENDHRGQLTVAQPIGLRLEGGIGEHGRGAHRRCPPNPQGDFHQRWADKTEKGEPQAVDILKQKFPN